jgi:predicted membrane-bound mannosyltransferase
LLLAFALALRVWKLTDKNIGLDESTSWYLATGSVSHLVSWTAADVHPPLYYLLLKVWLWVFGDSLVALRSLSVISSVIARRDLVPVGGPRRSPIACPRPIIQRQNGVARR